MDPTIKLELSLGEFQALTDLCKVAFRTVEACAALRPDGEMPVEIEGLLGRLKAVGEIAAAIDPAQANAAVMKLLDAIQTVSEGQLARALINGVPTGGLAQSISELKRAREARWPSK